MLDYYIARLKEFIKEDISPAQKAGLLLIIVFILSGLAVSYIINTHKKDKPQLVLEKTETVNESPKQSIFVHVAGEVVSPGLYKLFEGDRVADAVIIAGNALSAAHIDAVNLAEPLIDGMKVVVPRKEEDISSQTENLSDISFLSTKKVNINIASTSELETLTGVGPTTANKIIEYREKSGHFKSLEEIKNIHGIGEKKFESLKDEISIY